MSDQEWEEWEREFEEQQKKIEDEWAEYERLWQRIIELTEKFYSEIATTTKDPQGLDEFLDDMLCKLRKAGYCPPSPEDEIC